MKGENPKHRIHSNTIQVSASDDYLQHLAFENSLQANIICEAISGKIITVNSAACQLLGYSNEELITKNRSDIFDVDEGSFKQMLKERTATGHSKAFVTVLLKNEKHIPCYITSAVFSDKLGIEKAVITIEDLTGSIRIQKRSDSKKEKIVADNIITAKKKQKKIDSQKEEVVARNILIAKARQKEIDIEKEKEVAADILIAFEKQKIKSVRKQKVVEKNVVLAKAKFDAMLAKNNEWIEYIAKTSYDVMWDWDVLTNEVYVGDSIREVFGYKVKENTITFNDFAGRLIEEEKDKIKDKLFETLALTSKNWNDSFSLKRKDGSVALTTCRASIVRDEEGRAIRLIGAIQDVSRLQEVEKKLDEQIAIQEDLSETFLIAAKLSFDGIWDWNLLTSEVVFGEGFKELFGYTIKKNKGYIVADWSDHLFPADKKAVERSLNTAIASTATHWECSYRFTRANGTVAKVFTRASIIRDAGGKACRMIGAMQDVTDRKKNEAEKELIIRELLKSNADLKQFSYITSHNLRAPLSNIKSILDLIDYPSLNAGNAELLKLLNDSEAQLSRTIDDLSSILIIKNNVNAEIHTVGLAEVFNRLYKTFKLVVEEVHGKVLTDFADTDINFNQTYLESILINLFSNAIKYRSPDRNLIITAASKKDATGNTIFRFSDNGSGIDIKRYKDRLFGLYQRFHSNVEGSGLGLFIIKSQIEALNGNIEIESEPDKGTSFIITFKKQTTDDENEQTSGQSIVFQQSPSGAIYNF